MLNASKSGDKTEQIPNIFWITILINILISTIWGLNKYILHPIENHSGFPQIRQWNHLEATCRLTTFRGINNYQHESVYHWILDYCYPPHQKTPGLDRKSAYRNFIIILNHKGRVQSTDCYVYYGKTGLMNFCVLVYYMHKIWVSYLNRSVNSSECDLRSTCLKGIITQN